MKAARGLMVLVVVASMCVGIAAGQEVSSPAVTGSAPARIYEVGPDVVAPELLPMERTIPDSNACTRESDDEITLSVVVDAHGKPRDVTLINPVGTPLERLAMRIVEQDAFEPGTLKGEAVQVKLLVHVGIEGCYATKQDGDGIATEVFRLKAQPKQTFGEKRRQEYIAPGPSEPSESPAPSEPPAPATPPAQPAPETPGLYKIGNGVSAPVALNSRS